MTPRFSQLTDRVRAWLGSRLGSSPKPEARPARGGWLRRHRGTLTVSVAVMAGLGLGLGLVLRPVDKSGAAANVSLLDTPLGRGPSAEQQALERLREHVTGLFELGLPEGKTRRISYRELGVVLDTLRTGQLVRDSWDVTSPMSKIRRRRGLAGPIDLPIPLSLRRERATELLYALKDEFDRAAIAARIDLKKRQILPEQVGRLLDVDRSYEALLGAIRAGQARADLVFEQIVPTRTRAQLEKVEYGSVIASFETNYDRSDKAKARTFNLALAASRLDGSVIMPGEVFDFNDVVGPRDEATGYKVAPVIAQGELVDGIGGGTCQVSGTLHGAAFFAGLEIEERYSHTRPSSYIKMGLDATVVYPTINFKLKNPFEFPVVLHEVVEKGVVRAEILGPKLERSVTLIRRVKAAKPYEQLERADDKLPRGMRYLAQRGVPGFELRRYRIIRDGAHAERERWDEVYPPTNQIVVVGTGDPNLKVKRPADDPHPEYLADELLVMTVTPGDDGPNVFTDREPGKYGIDGWTAEAGMLVWRGDG